MKSSRYHLVIVCISLTTVAGLAYYWWTRPVLVDTGMTLEKAANIKAGMTYDEVVKVIGCKPGTYNEFLKNTNPTNGGKGGQFTLEDADIYSLPNQNKYDVVEWADFKDVRIKVIFTKDTHLVHKILTYRYLPEENAFRFAKPTLEATFSSNTNNVVAISEDEAVKIALTHLKQEIVRHDHYEVKARLDDETKEWKVLIDYNPELPGDHVMVTVDSATRKVIRVVGGM